MATKSKKNVRVIGTTEFNSLSEKEKHEYNLSIYEDGNGAKGIRQNVDLGKPLSEYTAQERGMYFDHFKVKKPLKLDVQTMKAEFDNYVKLKGNTDVLNASGIPIRRRMVITLTGFSLHLIDLGYFTGVKYLQQYASNSLECKEAIEEIRERIKVHNVEAGITGDAAPQAWAKFMVNDGGYVDKVYTVNTDVDPNNFEKMSDQELQNLLDSTKDE